MDFDKEALRQHKKLKGKIKISLKDRLDNSQQLSIYYTPGVAAVSRYVAKHPEQTRDYTWLNNSIAIVSDGSAVLGLGNIGPYGALPVMEGKAMLFKHFGGIDAIPIVLNVHSADEIVAAVMAIAPSFGGINLEDIAAPICFEVEERLIKALPIPVMHDDQHGTAIVVLAGLINALRLTGRQLKDCKIVLAGAGAAGVAVGKLIYKYGQPHIIYIDSQGIIDRSRRNLSKSKKELLQFSNLTNEGGNLINAIKGADVFIGVSQPHLLSAKLVKSMAKNPIIFALANPIPEIMPDEAIAAGAAIVATGRSDFPNQINNALAFPGIFRGALDHKVRKITDEHKISAAEAIANLVSNPKQTNIVPEIFDERLAPTVASVIM